MATDGADDPTCGSIDAPCLTIQYAIDEKITDSDGGWNIVLRGGTYQGPGNRNVYIGPEITGTSSAWNSIRSYPGEWAVIDGQRQSGEFGLGIYSIFTNSTTPNYHEGDGAWIGA